MGGAGFVSAGGFLAVLAVVEEGVKEVEEEEEEEEEKKEEEEEEDEEEEEEDRRKEGKGGREIKQPHLAGWGTSAPGRGSEKSAPKLTKN